MPINRDGDFYFKALLELYSPVFHSSKNITKNLSLLYPKNDRFLDYYYLIFSIIFLLFMHNLVINNYISY